MGVFGAIAAIIATQGLEILVLRKISFYFLQLKILFSYFGFPTSCGLYDFERPGSEALLKELRNRFLIAFNFETSSETVFPKPNGGSLNALDALKIVAFTLPLGYSFNLDGSMMYMTFASIAIAQAYNIQHGYWNTNYHVALDVMPNQRRNLLGVPKCFLVVLATCRYV